ncbi:MAG: type II toxin-antitoxin system HicB family antitoxin [Pseudomonadota bacterium]
MEILKYKDYEGTAELDMARCVCRGKILFIDDLVTYEAASPSDLQKEFEAAVDDYIETCTTLNREPQKPLKGQFNVRIPVALHKAATLRALADNISLNDVVVRALDTYVNMRVDVNHVETKNFYFGVGEMMGILSPASIHGEVYGSTVFSTGSASNPVVQLANTSIGGKHARTCH